MATGKWVEFVCLECGCNELEEVSVGTLYYSINGFYGGYFDYNAYINCDNTYVDRYQCYNCKLTIIDGDTHDLFNELLNLGYLSVSREDERPPQWEV